MSPALGLSVDLGIAGGVGLFFGVAFGATDVLTLDFERSYTTTATMAAKHSNAAIMKNR